jgi:radical SAM protein with 4Fe4S-binding SPASM domain
MGPNVSFLRVQDFSLWDKMAARKAVFSFELELTARCNNQCRHCYVNLKEDDALARSRELAPGEISRIADEAVSLGAIWCLITGGEPLLRDDFGDIYLSLKRKGLLVSVFTNGQCVTEDHVRLFRRYPPRDIEITVYGITRKTYERVTQKTGSFAAFNEGLNRLLNAGIQVRLKAMALRSNASELREIALFCRERTKDYFRFDPFLHLRSDGNARRNEEIQSERLTASEIAAIEQADAERADSLQKKCEDLINPTLSHKDCSHLFHCGAGSGSFYISYDGTFRLCASLCHPDCICDLRKQRLADAWRHLVPRVRNMRSSKREFLETCRVCPIVNLCLWCPAYAHLETGELDGCVKYFCDVAHARLRAIQSVRRSAI